MSLRTIIQKISVEFLPAKDEKIKGHPLVKYAEKDSVLEIASILQIDQHDEMYVKTSLGEGNWANIPWIAIPNKLVTHKTTEGYYPVYLWSADMSEVYLCMGQGVTKIKEDFGKEWKKTLQSRSQIIRSRIPEFKDRFKLTSFNLGGHTALAKRYEEAPAFGKMYKTNKLPSDEELLSDLTVMINLYNKLIFSGGVDLIENDISEDETGINLTLEERKKYRIHRVIEGRVNTNKVKKHHGYKCQACNFDFEEKYGELGKNYIEAHHLIPYSELKEGDVRSLNIETDFAVLCANCHRMIHRLKNVSDILTLKNRLKRNSVKN